MNRLTQILWLVIFTLTFSLGGCLAIHAEEKCMCIEEEQAFVDRIARRVVELQHQEQTCK